MRHITVISLVALACLVLTSAVRAEEVDPDAAGAVEARKRAAKTAKLRVGKFKLFFKSRNIRKKCNAMFEMCRDPHPIVINELGRVAKRQRNVVVKDALFRILADMKPYVDEAGAILKKHASKRHEDEPEILKSICYAIGKLDYKGAHDELLWMLDNKDQKVVIEAMRAIGNVGDMLAIPKLYDMAAYQGVTDSWSTGSVTVDTGASGTADQEAAEAAWKAKYGNVRPKRAGPTIVKMWMQRLRLTVEALTGQKFKSLKEFKAWMEAHPKEIGLSTKRRR